MSQQNIRRLIIGGFGLGFAAIAAYLDVHGSDSFLLWFGTLICFLEVL